MSGVGLDIWGICPENNPAGDEKIAYHIAECTNGRVKGGAYGSRITITYRTVDLRQKAVNWINNNYTCARTYATAGNRKEIFPSGKS